MKQTYRPGTFLFFLSILAVGETNAETISSHPQPSPTARPSPAGKKSESDSTARPHAAVHSADRATPQSENVVVTAIRHQAGGALEVITQNSLGHYAPGTNPMQMLNQVPGLNFVSDDALGNESWGSNLWMRGFTQAQLGVTLDGVPLGAQEYNTYNGLLANFAITSENIDHITVSDGGGMVATPATTNLGGAIQYFSSDPADRMGGKVSQMFGSRDTFRTFVRFDSGKLNPSGTKFYVSYVRSDQSRWKGSGNQFNQQLNAKLVQPVGESSQISAFFDWDEQAYFSYADQSLDILSSLGQRNDFYYPNYTAAYRAAQGIFPKNLQNYPGATDVSYYDGVTLSSEYLGGLNFDFKLNKHIRWLTTVYGHGSRQWSTWTDPYLPSPNGAPLSELVIQPQTRRFGLTSTVRYRFGRHHFESGVWYENNSNSIGEFMYQEPLLGQGSPINPLANRFGTPFQQNWGMQYNTNTFQFHLEDVFQILASLRLQAGFKSLLVTTHGGAKENDAAYTGQAMLASGSLTSAAPALPHFNALWTFLPHHEVYFDISKNMRAYDYGAYEYGSAWGVTNQQTFQQIHNRLKPETDWDYTIGYRYASKLLSASLDLYHVDFSNRLQSLTSGSIISPVSTLINVGSVTMNGLDAALTVQPVAGLSITNSISYNHSVYGQNVASSGVSYALKGKKVVNYPELMYKARISYTYHGAEAYFDANYISRRYLSYVNDTWVPSYWMTNLGARYRFGNYGLIRDVTVGFNVYNLINTKYVAQMGENGNPLSGDYQSIMSGSPRSYFGSISAGF